MINGFKGHNFYLSNSYPVSIPFTLEDGTQVVAPTVEHAYQASKTTDPERQRLILAAPTAQGAIRLGRSAETLLRPNWDSLRLDVMRRFLRQKFRDPVLLRKLTEETSALRNIDRSDPNWGCHFDEDGVQQGMNWLGHLLAQVREQAQQEGWNNSNELYYLVVVLPTGNGYRAYFNAVDYTQPYGRGATPLGAVADLVTRE